EARAGGVRGDRRRGDEQRWEVEQVVDPVPPSRHEAMQRPEGAPHPPINAPRARIDVAELPYGDRRGQEEDHHRDQPQSQARESELARRRGQPAEPDDSADVEQRSEERRVGKEGRYRWAPYGEQRK